jgi:hypothetical protein
MEGLLEATKNNHPGDKPSNERMASPNFVMDFLNAFTLLMTFIGVWFYVSYRMRSIGVELP